jgi:hypothetical protein
MEAPNLLRKLNYLYSKEFGIGVAATVVGGAILTFLLFFFNERVFPTPNLTGEWRIAETTTKTTHSAFMNVIGYSEIELLQKGCELIGSGDITSEKNPNGDTLTFKPEARVKIDVTGYFEHNFIAASKVYINIIRYGELTKSTTTYILILKDKDHLTGSFFSTIANERGTVAVERKK